jgi:hypothetical protein
LYYRFRSWHTYIHTLKLLQLRVECIIFALFILILWLIYWSLHTNMLQFLLLFVEVGLFFFYSGSGALKDMGVNACF